tara:strand:+ start:529 stop:687 length:159 start_codon:yes stop_codon:yes gene_type:complete
MVNCDFLGKQGICIHPVLKYRKGKKCIYEVAGVTGEWRCFFRLPKKRMEAEG